MRKRGREKQQQTQEKKKSLKVTGDFGAIHKIKLLITQSGSKELLCKDRTNRGRQVYTSFFFSFILFLVVTFVVT